MFETLMLQGDVFCIKNRIILPHMEVGEHFRVEAIQDWRSVKIYNVRRCYEDGYCIAISKTRNFWACDIDSLILNGSIKVH